MVEVFKTNVKEPADARMLLARIHDSFPWYTANFDLDDCDHILRVESSEGIVDVRTLMRLLKGLGFEAEILPDDKPVNELLQF